MKKVIKYILKEEGGKRFSILLALNLLHDPNVIISQMLALKNKIVLEGEKLITLIKVIETGTIVSYEHNWKKEGDVYQCKDCGVRGVRETPMSKIRPVRDGEKFKDCKWKIQP